MSSTALTKVFPTLAPEPTEPPRRMTGLLVVVGVHVAVGYALATGLAGQAIDVIKKPLQATLVQEIKPEPPPPPPPPPPPKQIVKAPPPPEAPPPPFVPPPEVAVAPSPPSPIAAVTATPPVEPPVIAPPAPPAPVAKVDIGVVCPNQVVPETPPKALRDGVVGLVRAEARVIGGKVGEVKILSGPRIFHDAVRTAMLQYRCSTSGRDDVIAVQEFRFELQ